MRLATCGGLLLLAVAVLAVGAEAAAFELRVRQLEQSWRGYEAAGVPSAQLATARAELQRLRDRHWGPLPYAVVSGAVLRDPLGRAKETGKQAYDASLTAARSRAQTALERLHRAGGPNSRPEYEQALLDLGRAHTPADHQRLAAAWDERAEVLEALSRSLAEVSGGLEQGRPSDVEAELVRLRQLQAEVEERGLSGAEAAAAIADAQIYLARPYGDQLGQHRALLAELASAASLLEARLDLQRESDRLWSRVEELLPLAGHFGALDLQLEAQKARQLLDSARASEDEGQLAASVGRLRALVQDLEAAAGGHLPLTGLPCLAGAPDKLIVIHLASQQLVAYDGGCPFLRTPVTTGRPALPTDRGTFHIFAKYPAYRMVSPWPSGSPFWYPTTWVYWAMEFVGDGTFLHNADWQPDSTYGPGSQFGPYASHGCVHVLDGPLAELYRWAPLGTTVEVTD